MFSFLSSSHGNLSFNAEPIYCSYADNIINPFIEAIEKKYKKYDCHAIGSGGGFLENVNLIDISFEMVKNCSVEEARLLVIEFTEDLLERINQDEKIRPYLKNYPFTEKEVTISISFSQKNGERVNSNYVALAFNQGTSVTYAKFNKKEEKLEKICSELYETSLKITQGKSPS